MSRLAFVLIALENLNAKKVTLELHEQKGLLEILEDVQIENVTELIHRPANIHDVLGICREKLKAAFHGPASSNS